MSIASDGPGASSASCTRARSSPHRTRRTSCGSQINPLPYGVALWPAAIALGHEIASAQKSFEAGGF